MSTMEVATRKITNRRGREFSVLLDAADAQFFDKSKWFVSVKRNGDVANVQRNVRVNGTYTVLLLHRALYGIAPGDRSDELIDHINGNVLDNRRANLRLATPLQNSQNRKTYRNNSTGFRGVSWIKRDNKFNAHIDIDGKRKYLGYFATAAEASAVYEAKAREVRGDFYRPL